MSSPSFCPRTGLGKLPVDAVVVVVEDLADTTQQTFDLSGAQVRWRVGGKGVDEADAAAAEEEEAGGAAKAREVDRMRSKRKRIMVSARRYMAPRVREPVGNLGSRCWKDSLCFAAWSTRGSCLQHDR